MRDKQQQPVSPTSPSWMSNAEEHFRTYLQAEKKTKSTVAKYVDESLHNLLIWYDKPPENLTKQDLQHYKEQLADKYCENSMVVAISAINQFLENVLERKDLRMKAPKRVDNIRVPLTEDEVRKILAEAKKKSPRDHALICLLYYAEMRADETTKLWVDDLDLNRRKVKVRDGKGKDHSTVNLSDYAVEVLKDYLENMRPELPATADSAKVLLLSVHGERLHRNDVWRIVKKLAFDAGIKKNVHPHIFRHSAITHMAEKGIQPYYIQAQSRHKSLDMVQKYIHLSEESVRTEYDRAFDGGAKLEPKLPAKPSPPAPRQEEDKVLNDLATLLGKLSEDQRRKFSLMQRNFEHRVELHGG